MSHAIEENDLIVVGYTDLYGKAWHDHENCTHCPEAVPVQFAEDVFDFDVEKRPCFILNADGEPVEVENQYQLVDVSTGNVLSYTSVHGTYEVIQNRDFLANVVGGILSKYDTQIESCGTLYNRRKAFMNVVIMEHTVKGDVSPTRTRILYANAFDNCAYTACVSQVRIVCANTFRAALGQGAANNTLKKFKHTRGALEAIGDYTIDLAEVFDAIKLHNSQLDRLAELQVSPGYAAEFLGVLFNYSKDAKEGRGKTMAANKVNKVTEIFETKDDLNSGGITGSRYALFNAVTDWADHNSSTRGGSDSMSREWEGIVGSKDKIKQDALKLLSVE